MGHFREQQSWGHRREEAERAFVDFSSAEDIQIPDLNPTLEVVTQNLKTRLSHVGIDSCWLIERATIFQRSISDLETQIRQTNINQNTKEAGLYELYSLTQILDGLLNKQVKLHITEETQDSYDFEGYYMPSDGPTKRLSIYQRIRDGYSNKVNRRIPANCQIEIYDILGRSSNGRAIAGSESALRIGLRHSFNPDLATRNWGASIDSGWKTDFTSKTKQWRAIGPLSQAVYEIKAVSEADDFNEVPYTYHFYDAETTFFDKPGEIKHQWIKRFVAFNIGLNHMFKELC